MLVVVIAMDGVAMAIVHVVDVVAVLHGVVTAVVAVGVVSRGVLGDFLMLVIVILVRGVAMAVVQVIDVVAVLHLLMAAIGAVGVVGLGVLSRVVLDGHENSLPGVQSSASGSRTGSWTWARASAMTCVTCRSARR